MNSVTQQDYYPFGMSMPGRSYTPPVGSEYRFGFNGKENDNEVKGNGNSLDFGARIYDPRIARWLSLDPLQKKYPDWTPYNFAINNPIMWIDIDGRDIIPSPQVSYTGTSNPNFANDLGSTDVAVRTLPDFNKQTNSYDIQVQIFVTYSALYNGPSKFNIDNPGFKSETEAHEEGHVDQITEVAQKSEITITYAGKTYTGKIDAVFNAASKDAETAVNKKYSTKKFNSQDELKKAQKQANSELKTEMFGILQSATNELQKKITNHIVDKDGNANPGIEDDANNRAAKKLAAKGQKMQYLNKIKPVKFNGKVLPWKGSDIKK